MNSTTILSDIRSEVIRKITDVSALTYEDAKRAGVEDLESVQSNFMTVRIAMLDFMLETYDSEKVTSKEKFNLVVRVTFDSINMAVAVLMAK